MLYHIEKFMCILHSEQSVYRMAKKYARGITKKKLTGK